MVWCPRMLFGTWRILREIRDLLRDILKVDKKILRELQGPNIQSGILRKKGDSQ